MERGKAKPIYSRNYSQHISGKKTVSMFKKCIFHMISVTLSVLYNSSVILDGHVSPGQSCLCFVD